QSDRLRSSGGSSAAIRIRRRRCTGRATRPLCALADLAAARCSASATPCRRHRSAARWRPRSVGGAVLVAEAPAAVGAAAQGEVVIGVFDLVLLLAVADLEVAGRAIAAIDELVAVARAGREARAHAGGQHLLALVRAQHQLPLEHVDQLVLVAVVVAHGRLLARRQGGEVDADAGEAERVAERALLARQDAGPERLRIAGADPRLQRGGIQ